MQNSRSFHFGTHSSQADDTPLSSRLGSKWIGKLKQEIYSTLVANNNIKIDELYLYSGHSIRLLRTEYGFSDNKVNTIGSLLA